jgi:chromosome segregation protein
VITEHEIKAETLTKEMSVLEEKLQQVDTDTQDALLSRHEEEKKRLLLESKLRELQSTIALRKQEEGEVALRKNHFEALLAEGVVIVGREILAYKEHKGADHHMTTPMHDLLRAIERSKLRIEEAGIPNAAEVIKEYKETTERDEYLTRELSDIKQSEEKLLMLIDELTKQLKERFVQGVLKVSENFTSFFSEIFDGGKAKLLLVDVIKLDEDGNELKEQGVDIEVKLPSKKIQELAMFSGGERALVSIALLFAMSSLTPPPFMVLDETDAPLDEHNARKYGSMLARLAEKSKLLVITHNRETMNHCDMLYGVTLGAEGTSKLLSIHFKDVAKTA